jgi:hypothetical protein
MALVAGQCQRSRRGPLAADRSLKSFPRWMADDQRRRVTPAIGSSVLAAASVSTSPIDAAARSRRVSGSFPGVC